jgi:hypothetical protein
MKRIVFESPEELLAHCRREAVDLVIEYVDQEKKQRQIRLAAEALDLETLRQSFAQQQVMAYYRKDGIFYEIVAKWQ